MLRRLMVLAAGSAALALGSLASANVEYKPSPLADYTVLTDGDGHYILVDEPQVERMLEGPVRRSLPTTIYTVSRRKLVAWQGSWTTGDPAAPLVDFDDPRGYLGSARLNRSSAGWKLSCGKPTEPDLVLRKVEGVARKHLMSKIRKGKPSYPWRPRFLTRDDNAYYYLVEELAGTKNRSYRLLRGTRAHMKRLKTKRLAADPAGFILVTSAGTFRFDRDKGAFEWQARGKSPERLLQLNTRANQNVYDFMIDELGAYIGVRFESACELLQRSRARKR